MTDKKTLQFPKGTAWISVSDGVVTNDKKWSETHVSASGGGASIINNTVYVQPVNVRSSVSEQTEFWVKEDDGTETAFRFSDVNFPVRPGQRVRIAWGANERRNQGGYLYAHNYASRESVSMVSNWYDWARNQRLVKKPMLYRLLTTWLSLALALLVGMVSVASTMAEPAMHRRAVEQARPVQQDLMKILSQLVGRDGFTGSMHAGDLLKLSSDTVFFASSGLSKISTVNSSKENQPHAEAALLGLISGLALWIPFAIAFHIVGALVFHIWWRRLQNKLIGQRIQPLFAV